MTQESIVIAGGTGFLGQALITRFRELGHRVYVLTRGSAQHDGNVHHLHWDGETLDEWRTCLEGASALINLSGKSVDCRYNARNKQAIYHSRLASTRVLGEALQSVASPPKIWLNAATATIYRHALDREMDEITGEHGKGFSVDVAERWERAFFDATTPGIRKVAMRTAIVLGHDGGAFRPLAGLTRVGLGGAQGPGNQFVTWLHIDDFVGMVEFAMAREDLEGPINFAAPHPVRNHDFMRALRNAIGIPFGLPMPSWLLEIGAVFIRTETELIFKSRNVIPKRLSEAGYAFKFPDLDIALKNLCQRQG